MPTFALNFSRPGAQIVLQYLEFLRLGRDGCTLVQASCREVAQHVASAIRTEEDVRLVSDGSDLPVVTFAVRDEVSRLGRLEAPMPHEERASAFHH